jgi:hypothetical protein
MSRSLFGVAIAAAAILSAPAAVADPDPSPPPIVPTPGGAWLPGNEVLPPICAHAMRACGYTLDPGTMTWRPSGTAAPESTSYNCPVRPGLSAGRSVACLHDHSGALRRAIGGAKRHQQTIAIPMVICAVGMVIIGFQKWPRGVHKEKENQ